MDDTETPKALPVACTLQPSDGRRRIARWDALLARGEPTVRRAGDQLLVAFAAAAGVHQELEALADAERRCCAFARWEVTADADHVVLTITSTADGLAAIGPLFGGYSTTLA